MQLLILTRYSSLGLQIGTVGLTIGLTKDGSRADLFSLNVCLDIRQY